MKKIFSAVALTLVCLAPSAAGAASLFDASVQLLRDEQSGKIYGVVNGKRYHFRSLELLRSYAFRSKKIVNDAARTAADLEPVRLIMSSLGPRVYLLDEQTGQKVWIPSEAAFSGMGERWDQIVQVSPDDSRGYRNARLLKAADDAAVYYIDTERLTRARIGSPEDFETAGLRWSDVLTVPGTLLAAYAEGGAFDPESVPAPEPEPSPQTGVRLTPTFADVRTSDSLPSGTTRNVLAKLHVAASGGTAVIESLIVSRRGISEDRDITDVALLDEAGFLLARPQQVSNGRARFTFEDGLAVSSSEGRTITLTAGFARDLSGSKRTVAFSILSGADIATSAVVTGAFPLESRARTLIDAQTLIGALTVDSVPLAEGDRSLRIGTTNVVLNRFRLTAVAGTEAVLLERLAVGLAGSARATDFSNLKLVDDHNRVLAKGIVQGSDVINFALSSPYEIPAGETRELILKADIVNGRGRSAGFVIENDFDVYARGKRFGYAVTVAGSQGGFPVGNRGGRQTLTITGGDVAIAVSQSSPRGAITRGARDVVFTTFEVRPTGQAVRFDAVELAVKTRSGSTPLVDALRVRPQKGGNIGSLEAASVMNESRRLAFDPTQTLAAERTATYEVVGSVSERATASDSYEVELSNARFTLGSGPETTTVVGPLLGGVRSVQEVTVAVRNDGKFTPSAGVAGKTGLKLGRFIIGVSAGEDVRVDEIVLEPIGGSAARFSEGFSNLKLGRAVIAAPSGGPYHFAVNSSIGAGREASFELSVDTTTAADGVVVAFRVRDIVAFGKKSNARITATLGDTVTPSIGFKRTVMTIIADPTFVGGATPRQRGAVVGRFTVTVTGAEDITIDAITVADATGSSGIGVTRGYRNLRLVETATGRTRSRTLASPSSGGGNRLTSGPTLAPNQSMTLAAVVDAESATVGDTITLQVTSLEATGRYARRAAQVVGAPLTMATVSF